MQTTETSLARFGRKGFAEGAALLTGLKKRSPADLPRSSLQPLSEPAVEAASVPIRKLGSQQTVLDPLAAPQIPHTSSYPHWRESLTQAHLIGREKITSLIPQGHCSLPGRQNKTDFWNLLREHEIYTARGCRNLERVPLGQLQMGVFHDLYQHDIICYLPDV